MCHLGTIQQTFGLIRNSITPRMPNGCHLMASQTQFSISEASPTKTISRNGSTTCAALIVTDASGVVALTDLGSGNNVLKNDSSVPGTLTAGSGNDYMFGGFGGDTLIDGPGNNYMKCGGPPTGALGGACTYQFAGSASGQDTIANF